MTPREAFEKYKKEAMSDAQDTMDRAAKWQHSFRVLGGSAIAIAITFVIVGLLMAAFRHEWILGIFYMAIAVPIFFQGHDSWKRSKYAFEDGLKLRQRILSNISDAEKSVEQWEKLNGGDPLGLNDEDTET